jgi:hypothetical protein
LAIVRTPIRQLNPLTAHDELSDVITHPMSRASLCSWLAPRDKDEVLNLTVPV